MRMLLALVMLLSVAALAGETMYRWKDSKGQVHYTNDRASIPAGAKWEITSGGDTGQLSTGPCDAGQ